MTIYEYRAHDTYYRIMFDPDNAQVIQIISVNGAPTINCTTWETNK